MNDKLDLIDRAVLLKQFACAPNGKDYPEKNGSGIYTTMQLRTIKEVVREAPSVDAVLVVHGWWMFLTAGIYQCSACKRKADTEFNNYKIYGYCPNCGAKMDLKSGDNNE